MNGKAYKARCGQARYDEGGKPWTSEEYEAAQVWHEQGLTHRQIAFILDRGWHSVRMKLDRHDGKRK